MTLADLNNNRVQIVATLTETVGTENVQKVMDVMIGGLDCCDTLEELMNSAIDICYFDRYSKKDSGNRFILGQLAEIND